MDAHGINSLAMSLVVNTMLMMVAVQPENSMKT